MTANVVAAGDLGADLLSFASAFNTTVGSSRSEWVSTATSTACQWSGVTCNTTNSTFALDLSSGSLSGGVWRSRSEAAKPALVQSDHL